MPRRVGARGPLSGPQAREHAEPITLLRGEATAQTVLDRITPMFQGQLPLSLRVPQMPHARRAHL